VTSERKTGFRVVERTTVCEAGFLTVERRRVAGPDNEEFDRHIVLHPGAVVVVPVDVDGNALLVRQYRVAAGRALLEVPAGKRDVHGETPVDTGARELEEEIGRRAGRLQLLCEFFNSPGFTDEYTYVFLATDLEVCDRAAESAEERAMTVEPVALADVEMLIASGELVDAKSIIGLLLARHALGGPEPRSVGPEPRSL
jgi:8-oxo-dGTP pyrophosphatase MutT (NUDIX family)